MKKIMMAILLTMSLNASEFEDIKKACYSGDANKCDELGSMYDLGLGVNEDKTKAVEYYDKACKGNSAMGCASLMSCYEYGQGIDVNKSKAIEIFTKVKEISKKHAIMVMHQCVIYLGLTMVMV